MRVLRASAVMEEKCHWHLLCFPGLGSPATTCQPGVECWCFLYFSSITSPPLTLHKTAMPSQHLWILVEFYKYSESESEAKTLISFLILSPGRLTLCNYSSTPKRTRTIDPNSHPDTEKGTLSTLHLTQTSTNAYVVVALMFFGFFLDPILTPTHLNLALIVSLFAWVTNKFSLGFFSTKSNVPKKTMLWLKAKMVQCV